MVEREPSPEKEQEMLHGELRRLSSNILTVASKKEEESMAIIELLPKELEVFRVGVHEALSSNILIIASGQDEGPFNVDPFSMDLGEETIAELDPERTSIIEEEVYKFFGITKESKPVTTYESQENENLLVSVFRATEFDEEENEVTMYLHQVDHDDGNKDWMISANQEPLL